MSTWIMYALIVFYVAILLAAAYERKLVAVPVFRRGDRDFNFGDRHDLAG